MENSQPEFFPNACDDCHVPGMIQELAQTNPERAAEFSQVYAALCEKTPPEKRHKDIWTDGDESYDYDYPSCCVVEYKGTDPEQTPLDIVSEVGLKGKARVVGEVTKPITRSDLLIYRLWMGIALEPLRARAIQPLTEDLEEG